MKAAKATKRKDDLAFWVAFNRIPGVGRVRYQALQGYFGSMADAWLAGLGELRAAGLDDAIARKIIAERANIEPERELQRLAEHGIRALTWHDPMYPVRLKEIDDAPPVLYVRGDFSSSDGWAVAVVGTRRPTPYGRQVAEELSYQLASNRICIVSGLARGVDAIAHRAALQASGRTVAVLAVD